MRFTGGREPWRYQRNGSHDRSRLQLPDRRIRTTTLGTRLPIRFDFMKVCIVYVCPVSALGPEHFSLACRFIASIHANPAGHDYELVVASNGGPPDLETQLLFAPFNARFIERSDEGWDIGAFIEVSHKIECEMVVCFGGPGYVRRAGWLKRMVYAWKKHGPGFYGSLSTYEVSPHINTTGFWCMPELLRAYPYKVVTREDRYNFEHRERACWRMAARMGLPVKFVTWLKEYDWPHWRDEPNIYRRGNQSACLTYFRHSDSFDNADEMTRIRMSQLSDRLTDPCFMSKRY